MDIAAVAETVSRDCSCTLSPEVINIANGVSARDPGPIPVRIPSRFFGSIGSSSATSPYSSQCVELIASFLRIWRMMDLARYCKSYWCDEV